MQQLCLCVEHAATMLRQRGYTITSLYGNPCSIPASGPDCPPDGSGFGVHEIQSLTLDTENAFKVLEARVGPFVPHHTSLAAHLERGSQTMDSVVEVYVAATPKLGVHIIRELGQDHSSSVTEIPSDSRETTERTFDQNKTLILISRAKLTHMAKSEFLQRPFRTELFLMQELFQNVTTHALQPKHFIVPDSELSLLLPKNPISSLPRLRQEDPLCRFHGLEKGDVMCCRRKRVGLPGGLYYRAVL